MDARLAKVHSSSLSDAMRGLHPHRHHVLDLMTPTPGRVLFGPAATMLFAPLRADVPKDARDFERHLRAAAGEGPAGRVLVCACPGVEDAAVAGGVRARRVAGAGFSGLLTTSRLRDLGEVAEAGLVVFARGETPFAGSAESMPVATNVPLALDGATVLPGDFVFADEAGAVIIPAPDVERVLDRAVAIEAEDAAR